MRLSVLASLACLIIGSSQLAKAQKNCLDFDGDGDYIEIPDFTLPSNFTIEYRFKADTQSLVPFAERVISFGHQWRLEFGLTDDGESTYLWFFDQAAGGSFFVPSQEVRDGQWHHITIRYYPEQISFFIDGRLRGFTDRAVSSRNYGPKMRIGSWTGLMSSRTFFNGQIDEIRIWERPMPPSEIEALLECDLSGDETGLLAYWSFDQGMANAGNPNETTLYELNGKHGTLNGFALTGEASNWIASDPAYNICGTISNQQEVIVDQNLRLFPNPGNGQFKVLSNTVTDQDIRVYNAYGVLLQTLSLKEGNQVDLTNYPDGLYLIESSSGNQRRTIRYLKRE